MEALREDIAIETNSLKKKYRLGQYGAGTLTHELQSWWAKVRGREDPNTRIGEDSVEYGKEFSALDGIDLTIKKGEVVGIIGANGAGKSTLLKILTRITAPTEGLARINGRVSSMLEVGTGFNPEMTGRENVYINGAILGMTKAEVDRKMADIITFSECEQFIDTPVKRYSSGMYVKLAFAVAAHLDSEIVIMDEVLAVGDIRFQQKCLEKMRGLAEDQGRTILFVSHNMASIRQLCKDRTIVLDKGRVVYDGETDNAIAFYTHDDIRDRYSTETELSYRERSSCFVQRVVMRHLSILSRETMIFPYGEAVRCALTFTSKEDFDHVCICAHILRQDQQPIGRMYSNPIKDVRAGTDYRAEFILDLGSLCCGKYILYMEVSQLLDGCSCALDALADVCFFEITASEQGYPPDWDEKAARFWGNVRFRDISIVRCKRTETVI